MVDVDSDIAGFYLLEPSGQGWKLQHLWVSPEFIRRGFGRALLNHAAAIARLGGAVSIEIDAEPHAEGFYVACGAEDGLRRSR